MEKKEFQYELEFMVRDYECDLQGIVNNANYQHYLEHARHQFLVTRDIDFAELHAQGIDLVVSRVEIDYKHPLVSRDRFVVKLSVHKEGALRVVFDQEISRSVDGVLIVQAKVIGVGLRNGKPIRPGEISGFKALGL